MTTETKSLFDTVKDAFAPMTDALKNFPKTEVPEQARDFVKKTASTAKERAADAFSNSEKVTAALETAAADSLTEAAKISRNVQQAIHQEAQAFFAGIDRLASANSFSEAVQIQSELARARGEVFASNAKSTVEYVGQAAANGVKSAQDTLNKVFTKTA